MNNYYVYELAYPTSMGGAVFYVGKGTGNRINLHETEARSNKQSYKCDVIRQIWSSGEKIIKRKVQDAMSEEAAYAFEIDLIRMYGREYLTNLTNGGEGAPIGNKNATKKDSEVGHTLGLYVTVEDEQVLYQTLINEGTPEPTRRDIDRYARLLVRWTIQKEQAKMELQNSLQNT